MDLFFYNEWKNVRLNRIIEFFGKKWFENKKILELGAAHGDIGIELMRLGANVTFTDISENNLKSIQEKINFPVPLYQLDQNKKYDLSQEFDLILHLGVLYHLNNWQQDIISAFSHSNYMILETCTGPLNEEKEILHFKPEIELDNSYDGAYKEVTLPTKKTLEKFFKKNNYRFLDISNSNMNTPYSFLDEHVKIRNLYEWTDTKDKFIKNNIEYRTHFRKMWFLIK